MKSIGITGSRFISELYYLQTRSQLWDILSQKDLCVHVGDASGIDWQTRQIAAELGVYQIIYQSEPRTKWALHQRSRRLVDALASTNGILYAFPNRPCPDGISVSRWMGSGTWGTMLYAKSLHVPIQIYPQGGFNLPDWLYNDQLSLI